jgi:hypothetical protein
VSEPATKEDLEKLAEELRQATKADIKELRLALIDREIKSIRWFIATFLGAQIAYFAITLSAVYFLLHSK